MKKDRSGLNAKSLQLSKSTNMNVKEKEEYHKKVDECIRDFGYYSTYVFGKTKPSFCYSTGIFKSFNIPEVFISSLPQNLSFEIIRNYVKLFKGTKDIPLNTKIDNLVDRFPVILIDAPLPRLNDYVLTSFRFYKNENFKYLQIIFPDTIGNFPFDEGYNYDQEIKGDLEY